ncbi:Retrovirus-related Pol polyprotein from transposon RE1 [Vitis vinifera]|uniref:Retrovirus-related Pol polyprotein from transposon RE1 n=1 Tax=Vitis vinifera TaxID=29760 RepID=A0A438C402_VITVI|nr:Retrovirus-related Pol polyprotein from transposon RE1 [Vitis vinifera]
MLPLPIWSHATEHENATEYGDVEEEDITQPTIGKKTDILKPAVAENVDSDLMVYSRRPRLPMQEIYHQYKASTTHFSSDSVPKNVKEALSDPRWKEAINEEMKALSKNETWDIIDLPKEKNQWDTSGTPIDQNHQLDFMTEGIPVDKGRYQRLVGRLIYLSHTRPDIAYAISMVSSIIDEKSTLGYYTLVDDNFVTWRSKKKHVVVRSSVEAEFQTMALGICELMWIKGLLRKLQVNLENPMRLYCDNKAAVSIAHNLVQHNKTKHVEIERHFIKEKIDSGLICTLFIASKLQLADVFTKGVQNPTFNSMVSKLGMDDIFEST